MKKLHINIIYKQKSSKFNFNQFLNFGFRMFASVDTFSDFTFLEINSFLVCRMPLVTGPCRARMPRFGYVAQSRTCKEFIYGGCDGNDNNFIRKDDCYNFCSGIHRD